MTETSPQLGLAGRQSCGLDDSPWTEILQLVTDCYPCEGTSDRRRDNRYPFPFLVYLTAVGEDGLTPAGEPLVGAGKDLSEGGLGFYHSVPLRCRRLIVSVERRDGRWLGFLFEPTRSRAIRQGWYESSGRILQSVRSPLEQA
jgi:hypothetical protein